MKHEEKLNWGIYWVGIAFILTCLSLAVTAEGQADPCQWEIDNAKSVCRALGKRSPECATAIDKVQLCRSEATGTDDPLEGLSQRCVTECFTNSLGITTCTTRCYDERGARR
jgi:hypothetical protein